MDAHTDTHLGGNTNQNALVDDLTMAHEHGSGGTALVDSPVLEKSHVHNSIDTSNIEPQKEQIPICSSVQEHSDAQSARDLTIYEHSYTGSRGDSSQAVPPATPEYVVRRPLQPPSCGAAAVDTDELEVPKAICSQGDVSLLCSRKTSATASLCEKRREPDLNDIKHIQATNMDLGLAHGIDLTCLTDEAGEGEDFDHPCEDPASSLPPSSSPLQVFSSSPCASSQSSVGDSKPQNMVVIGAETADCASPLANCSPTVRDESHSMSKSFHDHDAIHVETQVGAKHCSDMDSTLCLEGSPGPSRKRMASQNDHSEPHGSPPAKRPKRETHLYLPPTPLRATLASQDHQFKKLASPFRAPSKLPVARDKSARTMNSSAIDSDEIACDKPDLKELTMHVLRPQHKVSSASRSVTQFRSPLMNRVLPTESRAVRLTPALQALERKLQVLKRAIKVKEGNEEEMLTRLSKKWIEAGREVACDVWDATKDAGNPERRTELTNVPWGWDCKLEDSGGESRDLDPPMTSERLAAEGDDDVSFSHTLGAMLRQLGIAPEIFGWDDDQESFLD